MITCPKMINGTLALKSMIEFSLNQTSYAITVLAWNGFEVDPRLRLIKKDGAQAKFSPLEWNITELFLDNVYADVSIQDMIRRRGSIQYPDNEVQKSKSSNVYPFRNSISAKLAKVGCSIERISKKRKGPEAGLYRFLFPSPDTAA